MTSIRRVKLITRYSELKFPKGLVLANSVYQMLPMSEVLANVLAMPPTVRRVSPNHKTSAMIVKSNGSCASKHLNNYTRFHDQPGSHIV